MLQIKLDTKGVTAALGALARQVPYAASRTINGLAYQAQQEIRQELGQHFTVRRPTFLQQSIKVVPSRKDHLVAQVGVFPRPNSGIDQALAAQEFGGDRPSRNGRSVSIPLAARPNPTDTTPPSKWPGQLKRAFVVKTKAGNEFILQRTGRRSRKRGKVDVHAAAHAASQAAGQRQRDPNLQVMYELKPRVEIRPRWGFERKVLDVVKRDLHARFARELESAIRTAR